MIASSAASGCIACMIMTASSDEQGGIERWLVLTDCLGLDRDYVTSMRGALPQTRFAVEAYVRFVVEQPLVVALRHRLRNCSLHRSIGSALRACSRTMAS